MADNSNLGDNTSFGGYNFGINNIIAGAQNPYAINLTTPAPSVLPSLTAPKTGYTEPNGSSLQAGGQTTGLIAPQLVATGAQAPQSTSNTNSANPALNQNALSLASQAAQHSGLFGDTLGTLTSSIDNFGAGTGLFSAPAAAETVSPAVAAADAASTASFTGGSTAAAADAGLATSAEGTSAAAGLGITLSGALTAGGLGALGGGILASALGENPTGGSIGGGVGAIAGFAIGGPIGAIVGGIGGSLFGGLFGNNSPPTSDSAVTANLTPSGALSNQQTAGKNSNSSTDAYTASAQENFSSIANAANTALGIQFDPNVEFGAQISTRHGGASLVVTDTKTGQTTGNFYFNPQDPGATQQAYAKALTAAASYSGYTDTSKLTDWYNNTYVNSNNGATNVAPSLPNNPNANQSASTWNNFITQYAQQQNAGAAQNQTTVGGKSVTSYQTQGTTNANASPTATAA